MEPEIIKEKLLELLKIHSKKSVAKKLGISRKTLYKYIDKLGIADQIPKYNKDTYIQILEDRLKKAEQNREL